MLNNMYHDQVQSAKNRIIVLLYLLFALLWTPTPLHAQSAGFSGSIGIASEYVFLGISQTRGNPTLQGGIHYEFSSGFYTGIWLSPIEYLSNYHLYGHSNYEMDISAGYRQRFDDHWFIDLVFTRYHYEPGRQFSHYEYNEFLLTMRYKDRFLASAGRSRNIFNRNQHSYTYELGGQHPLATRLILSYGMGYHDLDNVLGERYRYWNIGLSTSFGPIITDLSYFDTDQTATSLFGEHRSGGRTVLNLIYSF